MHVGTIKWFNGTKGYGFISRDDVAADVYVHLSEVRLKDERPLARGQRVRFDIARSRDGRPSATNVAPL